MRLISKRLQEGSSSRPGQRGDGFKLGLVVEGGGMRGIVTGAMLMGLQDMGLTHCFDAVYGASAGAINSTYFLTGNLSRRPYVNSASVAGHSWQQHQP